MKLRFDAVSKSFGDNHVLREISIDVAAGEVVTFIGASGSGKSTLLRCVNLLETIDAGSISLDGDVITNVGVDPNPVRRRVGMVFQSYNLFPHMSVARNVTLALTEVLGVESSEAMDRARTLLDRFGLADKIDRYPDQLSGGQQQRVAIARAILPKPALVLADEPTGNLDEGTADTVLELLSELVTESGAGLVLVTHSERLAGRMDRRLHLRAGRLA